MKDLLNNSTVKELLAAKQQHGTLADLTGTSVDLKGEGRKCLLLVSVGATSTATASVTVQESVDNSAWTTLGDVLDIETTGLTEVDLTPTKRYIRVVVGLATTEAGETFVDIGILGVIYNERYIPSNVA